jgi:adenylate kinase
MKILVTGTPGVGKTTFSQKLAEKYQIEHVDISKFIKLHKIYENYDEKFDTLVFKEEKVAAFLKKYLKSTGSYIIDTHSPKIVKNLEIDYVFHLECDSAVLYDRLSQRGYSKVKIDENIQSEIFNVIGEEIEDMFDQHIVNVNGSGIDNEQYEEALNIIQEDMAEYDYDDSS